MAHSNRRGCPRSEDGYCLYYNMDCNEVPKNWEEYRKTIFKEIIEMWKKQGYSDYEICWMLTAW